MQKRRFAWWLCSAAGAIALVGCQSGPPLPPLTLASRVDIPRFMGEWFVIASIPTIFEKNAFSAKDIYRLAPDGSIATTFSYRDGGFDGPLKEIDSKGSVLDTSGAVWGQQYIWPIQADYRITYVSSGYDRTVVAREKRDYVWIMARTPTLPDAQYQELVAWVGSQGYDVAKLVRVPQSAGMK